MSSRLVALLAAASFLAPGAAHASAVSDGFRTLSVGISGGFQTWSLDGLEQTLADRAQQFDALGYHLDRGDFGPTYSYGVEIQVRLTERFFFRTQADWTRLKWEDTDREPLAQLGASIRDQFSVRYTSRVKTRPLLFALGAGTATQFSTVRVGLSANALIAPVTLEDTITLSRNLSDTVTKVTSTGTGTGLELDLGVDWFTDVRTNLFVEVFWRTGSTRVSLDQTPYESSILPGERRIDFAGEGIRLGFRWI